MVSSDELLAKTETINNKNKIIPATNKGFLYDAITSFMLLAFTVLQIDWTVPAYLLQKLHLQALGIQDPNLDELYILQNSLWQKLLPERYYSHHFQWP